MKYRVLVFFIGFILPAVCFWLGGFDFNERGADAVLCFILCLIFGVVSSACPALRDLD